MPRRQKFLRPQLPAPVQTAVPEAAAPSRSLRSLWTDDGELVAVITAAIAASERQYRQTDW